MKDLKVVLEFKDGKFDAKADREASYAELMQILCNGALSTMRVMADSYIRDNPDLLEVDAKTQFYDFANEAFTFVLENFLPDKEMRPDLDSQAILEASEKLHEEHAAKIKAEAEEDAAKEE